MHIGSAAEVKQIMQTALDHRPFDLSTDEGSAAQQKAIQFLNKLR
jgi:hypothetical protein